MPGDLDRTLPAVVDDDHLLVGRRRAWARTHTCSPNSRVVGNPDFADRGHRGDVDAVSVRVDPGHDLDHDGASLSL